MEDKEVWRPLITNAEEFEGIYKVSNFGRIRSYDRHIEVTTRGTPYKLFRAGRTLKARKLTKDNLLFVDISITLEGVKIRETIYIHKAVADAFVVNRRPKVNTLATHKDLKDWTNNHTSNIIWASPSFISIRNMVIYPQNRDKLKEHNIASGYYKSLKKDN